MSDIRPESARLIAKGLSALLIGLSLAATCYILWGCRRAGYLVEKDRISELWKSGLLPSLTSATAGIGFRCGVQGLRKNDIAMVKGLVGAYCFYLIAAIALALLPIQILQDHDHADPRYRFYNILFWLSAEACAIAGVAVYAFSARWGLRALALGYPPVLQLIPSSAILGLRAIIWMAAPNALAGALVLNSSDQSFATFACVCGLLADQLLRKLALRLESEPEV